MADAPDAPVANLPVTSSDSRQLHWWDVEPPILKRINTVHAFNPETEIQADTDNVNDPGYNLGHSLKPKYATWKDWAKNKPTDEYMNRGGKRRKKSTRRRKMKSKSKKTKRRYRR